MSRVQRTLKNFRRAPPPRASTQPSAKSRAMLRCTQKSAVSSTFPGRCLVAGQCNHRRGDVRQSEREQVARRRFREDNAGRRRFSIAFFGASTIDAAAASRAARRGAAATALRLAGRRGLCTLPATTGPRGRRRARCLRLGFATAEAHADRLGDKSRRGQQEHDCTKLAHGFLVTYSVREVGGRKQEIFGAWLASPKRLRLRNCPSSAEVCTGQRKRCSMEP
jgi:hypothetical protein